MKMVGMKLQKISKKEQGEDSSMPGMSKDEYPYGLKISLNEEQLKKMEHVANLSVGDEVDLEAKGKITSMSSDERSDGKNRSVTIQITSLSCDCSSDNEDDMSDEKYGKYNKLKKMMG